MTNESPLFSRFGLLVLLLGAALGVAVALLFARNEAQALPARAGASASATPLPADDSRLLAEVLERVKGEYVDTVDERKLMQHALHGVAAGLDPYSAYLDADEYQEIRDSTSGTYPGVGIEVSADRGGIKVMRTLQDSPAARADLRPGDLIVGIDNAPVGRDLDRAIDKMRGLPGTRVSLAVRRPGTAEVLDLTLERAQVEVHSVAARLVEPGFGYLRITNFSANTAADVERAVANLRVQNGGSLQGLVIDLRNNPGGVLESAVEVADAFLNGGVIVSAIGRTPDARFRMEAHAGDLLDGAPLAVLVNGATASAAEILAGALKDTRRAAIVGRRTFGKGSVQTVIPLSGGRALKLTTSRYFTPSGVSIQDRGIEPDLPVEGVEEPPLGVDAPDSLPLARRDREVRIAVQHLKSGSKRITLATRPG
jgi:carboxyl-terminal processing protease